MPWVEFMADYDERITDRHWKRRQAGTVRFVRREVARDAVDRGKARLVERPDTSAPAATEEDGR